MIQQVADARKLSGNIPGISHGAIEQAISRNISIRQVARTIEQVADSEESWEYPREFPRRGLASGTSEIFCMASHENDRTSGRPTGARWA